MDNSFYISTFNLVSFFYQTTRTNDDVEGWQRALNQKAGKAKLPLHVYLLLNLLAKEAESVSLEVQPLSMGTLSRYQRQCY